MNLARVEEMLRQTLADLRLSRGERQALHAALEPDAMDDRRRALVRDRAFALAADEVARLDGREVLGWLAEVLSILEPESPARVAECHFSPGPAPRERLLALIGDARRTLDVCVFTITDDTLAHAVLDA